MSLGQGDAQHDATAQQEPRILQEQAAPGALAGALGTLQRLGELGQSGGLSGAGVKPSPVAARAPPPPPATPLPPPPPYHVSQGHIEEDAGGGSEDPGGEMGRILPHGCPRRRPQAGEQG